MGVFFHFAFCTFYFLFSICRACLAAIRDTRAWTPMRKMALGVAAGKPASADLPYTDGVLVEDSQFDNAFPYLRTPIPGSPNGKNGESPNM